MSCIDDLKVSHGVYVTALAIVGLPILGLNYFSFPGPTWMTHDEACSNPVSRPWFFVWWNYPNVYTYIPHPVHPTCMCEASGVHRQVHEKMVRPRLCH